MAKAPTKFWVGPRPLGQVGHGITDRAIQTADLPFGTQLT